MKTDRRPPAWLTHTGVVIGLGLIVLVSSLAIGAPATTMIENGVSVDEFQFAGTSEEAERAYDDLGPDGRRAARWFLGLELPFLFSFGLLLCAGCAFAAGRLAAVGVERLARLARFAVVFGALAAAFDLAQNISLTVILSGDFGTALRTSRPVLQDIASVFPATLELATVSLLFGAGIGIPLGVYAAARRGTALDTVARIVTLGGYSIPNFWLALTELAARVRAARIVLGHVDDHHRDCERDTKRAGPPFSTEARSAARPPVGVAERRDGDRVDSGRL